MKSKTVFVDIDTQFDFMHPQGSLYVPGAETLEPNLKALLNFAQQKQIPIVASADAHAPDDPEFEIFPAHCVAGTAGQQKIPATRLAPVQVIANSPQAVSLAAEQPVVLEKTVFDIFGNPNAEAVLKQLGVTKAVVFGVATDYCVKAAALGFKQRGYDVTVVSDAIKAVTAAGEAEALAAFAENQIQLKTTQEIIGGPL